MNMFIYTALCHNGNYPFLFSVGRIISGYPLSLVATQWSWQESFYVALGVSVSVAVISTICRKLLSNEIKAEKKDS